MRLPDGVGQTPRRFESRVKSDPGLAAVALRIDRAFSPWTPGNSSDRCSDKTRSSACRSRVERQSASRRGGGAPLLVGRRRRNSVGRQCDVRMHYGVLDLGAEKLVARYVGSAEQLAYNESVLRDSLVSLDGQRLIAEVVDAGRAGSNGHRCRRRKPSNLPVPAGWVDRAGGAVGSAPASRKRASIATIYPDRDITLALRAAVWDAAHRRARGRRRSACSSRRGSSGACILRAAAEWLGVSYSIEGAFLRLGSQQVVQLEVIAPDRKSAFARALLAAWIKKASNRRGKVRFARHAHRIVRTLALAPSRRPRASR